MKELSERYLAAKRRLFDKYYSDLNPEQRAAVFSVNGPLLVLAGAGSGKTTVLVRRIAYIIRYGNAYHSTKIPHDLTESRVRALEEAAQLPKEQIADILPEFIDNPCPPYKMLAITFTNKAAREIKSRLELELGEGDMGEIWTGTFHSICMRILRANANDAGLVPGFSVYDAEDSKKALSAAMKRCNIAENTMPLKGVANDISRAKDKLIGPGEYLAEIGNDFRSKQVARIYAEYQSALAASNALDFDDIIFRTVMLLRNNENIRRKYQARFEYICVDEYQDTNAAQFALTSLLADGYRNIMVVGDDDQSIYRFRGATIENILSFDKTYSDAKVIRLEQNYRSSANIIEAANGIIGNNRGRHDKKLWTQKQSGEPISVCEFDNQEAEARFIVETVSRSVRSGERRCGDFAVLYRTNAQSRSLEAAFVKSGVPYRTLGSLRFFDRKEIKDIIAYLGLIANPSDAERLKRIINEPKRKIGEKTIEEIERIARAGGVSMFEVIEHASRYMELSRSVTQLLDFADLIHRLSALSAELPVHELIRKTTELSGYRDMLLQGGEAERDRLENIEELISSAMDYEKGSDEPTLAGYLEEVALISDVDRYDETADAVVLMTVHSAKGLEFPVVFVPGMEDGIFPGMQTINSMRTDDMEEERRLAYVAITRAKEKLYLLHTRERSMWGSTMHNKPSRFIQEIPPQLIEKQSKSVLKDRTQQSGGSKVYFSQKQSNPAAQDISVNRPLVKPKSAGELEDIAEGDRVRHRIFGEGEVLAVHKMGADILYEVSFDTAGTKKLMASFAKLTKIK